MHEYLIELPLIDEIVVDAAQPFAKATCNLNLNKHNFLRDHLFINASEVKEHSSCLPILPFAVALEISAQSAAPLAPSFGFAGFSKAFATRWVELLDSTQLALEVDSRIVTSDIPDTLQVYSVIRDKQDGVTYFSTNVLFRREYKETIGFSTAPASRDKNTYIDSQQLYRSNILVHGSSLQGLLSDIEVSDTVVRGHATTFPEGLLATNTKYTFYTDPVVLDSISQLIFTWALNRKLSPLPISLGHLEVYNGTPHCKSKVEICIEVVSLTDKIIEAKVEAILTETQRVWFRGEGFKFWAFNWSLHYHRFRCAPTKYCLSQKLENISEFDGICIMSLDDEILTDAIYDHLARGCLTSKEMQIYNKLPGPKEAWLKIVILIKDLVRSHEQQTETDALLHPAAIELASSLDQQKLINLSETLGEVRFQTVSIGNYHLELKQQSEAIVGLIQNHGASHKSLKSLGKNKLELKPVLVQDYMAV